MREELLRVLNFKLESINKNIDNLNNINGLLDDEQGKLDYVDRILDSFKGEDDQYEINNFVGLDKENFDKVMDLMPEGTFNKFQTNSCNYEGLIYLINGIKNGISLTLTSEQEEAIQSMLNGLNDKKLDYLSKIEGYNLDKSQLEESDLSVLEERQSTYENILDEMDNNNYVGEVEAVIDSIDYSHIDANEKSEMLSYLLKYNADIYGELKENGGFREEVPFEDPVVANIEIPEEAFEEAEKEEQEEDEEKEPEYPEMPVVTPEIDLPIPEEPVDEPYDLPVEEPSFSDLVATPLNVELGEEETTPEIEIPEQVFDNLVNETNETPSEEPTNTVDEKELTKVLEDYHIKLDDLKKNELLKGDIESYKDILNIFKDNDLLSDLTKNEEFLNDILLNSNKDVVNEIFDIVRKEFSIDEEDFYETARITIDSMPSIFVKEPVGNYDNFMKNVDFFKGLNFDMISLFDFSRELLLVDNELLRKNYELVSKYDVKVETKNAKYLLALKNSVESIDYYVEALYEDKVNNKVFDGINIVKTYPSKLDSVTDLTIKRLRYSSENGKKMFGSRENSIAGEIANLKVDILNIPEDYFAKFFNNEFNDITKEEVDTYLDMINKNTDYNFRDNSVLAELNKYRNGNRYNIAGVNISYNKVLRNYNILINNNVDNDKALEFAVCYNLVCTKEEYESVANELKAIGGK